MSVTAPIVATDWRAWRQAALTAGHGGLESGDHVEFDLLERVVERVRYRRGGFKGDTWEHRWTDAHVPPKVVRERALRADIPF